MTDSTLTKGERTRQAIEEAAYELFLEQGYSATSMRQIAERAGIALGGIYNHFSGKDEIFQELIICRHPYLKILPIIQRAPGDTTEEFVRNSARTVQDELGRHPDFIKLMFIEVVEFNGKHFPKLYDTIFPQVFPLLQRFTSAESGVRDMPLPQLIRAFMGSIMAFYLTEFLMASDQLPPSLREMSLEEFMDIFLYGILLPKVQDRE
jgi:AcrR family transcriptional regulator